MYIVFQKKSHSILDKLISFVTHSPLVHCELVSVKLADTFYGYTSEPFVGVRAKWIKYSDDDWVFVKLPNNIRDLNDIKTFYNTTKGKKYDYLGVLGFVFGNRDNKNRYFCSEWCSEALGFKNPSKISPGKLYEMVVNIKDE